MYDLHVVAVPGGTRWQDWLIVLPTPAGHAVEITSARRVSLITGIVATLPNVPCPVSYAQADELIRAVAKENDND